MKNPLRHLCSVLGFLAVAIYIAMAIAAWTYYPAAFNPLGNWLSDLGNNDLNPDGALLYRLGGVLGGLGLAGFFLSLDGRAWGERRAARVLSALVRVFGTLAAACFIMTGVFSEDMMPLHSWFSIANYAAFGTAIALTGLAGLFGAAIPKSLAVFCFVAWGVDIASAYFGQTRWLEWVVVGFLVVYLISFSTVVVQSTWRSIHSAVSGECNRG